MVLGTLAPFFHRTVDMGFFSSQARFPKGGTMKMSTSATPSILFLSLLYISLLAVGYLGMFWREFARRRLMRARKRLGRLILPVTLTLQQPETTMPEPSWLRFTDSYKD